MDSDTIQRVDNTTSVVIIDQVVDFQINDGEPISTDTEAFKVGLSLIGVPEARLWE